MGAAAVSAAAVVGVVGVYVKPKCELFFAFLC